MIYLDVWSRTVYLPVKSAWPEQSIVEDVHPVGGGQDDNIRCSSVETVHLDQELKQKKNIELEEVFFLEPTSYTYYYSFLFNNSNVTLIN